jgi:hypothetical protein
MAPSGNHIAPLEPKDEAIGNALRLGQRGGRPGAWGVLVRLVTSLFYLIFHLLDRLLGAVGPLLTSRPSLRTSWQQRVARQRQEIHERITGGDAVKQLAGGVEGALRIGSFAQCRTVCVQLVGQHLAE